jgi:hypothetical protein
MDIDHQRVSTACALQSRVRLPEDEWRRRPTPHAITPTEAADVIPGMLICRRMGYAPARSSCPEFPRQIGPPPTGSLARLRPAAATSDGIVELLPSECASRNAAPGTDQQPVETPEHPQRPLRSGGYDEGALLPGCGRRGLALLQQLGKQRILLGDPVRR